MPLNNSAIEINAGFELGSSQPIDSRLILTKAQMLAIDENIEPSNYLALCKDDGRLYIYNSANTIDVETGKFRPSNTVNIQYTDMPLPSAEFTYPIQYIGADTNDYKNGYWYKVVDNGDSTYSWSLHSIGDYYTKTEVDALNIEVTQAQYDQLVEDGNVAEDTDYYITDTKVIMRNNVRYSVIDDSVISKEKTWSSDKIKKELAVADGTFVVTTDDSGRFKIGNLNKYLASEIVEVSNTETNGYMAISDFELDSYGNYYATARYVWGERPLAINKTFRIAVKWIPITTNHQEGITDGAGYIALWGTWEEHNVDSNILCASNKDYASVYDVKVNSPDSIRCDTVICNSAGFWRLRFVNPDNSIYEGAINFDYNFIIANENTMADKTESGIFEHNNYSDIENVINQLNSVDPIHHDTTVPSTFIWFSDIHADTENLERIVQLHSTFSTYSTVTGELVSSKFSDVICTGDMVKLNASKEDIGYWDKAGARKFLMTMGNHDSYNSSDGVDTAQNVSNRWGLSARIAEWGAVSGGSDVCYYYKDYPNNRLRLIVLDCMHLNANQLSWLNTTLDSAKSNGLAVVCTSHYYATQIIDGRYQYLDTSFNQGHSMTNDNISEAADVVNNFIVNGGEFVCWLCGHEHRDNTFLSKEYPKQIILGIEMATHYTEQIGQPSVHVNGTKSQDAFDIISFDTYRKLIRVYRVGNDQDQYLRRRTSMCIDYANRRCLYNESPSADFSFLQVNPRYVLHNWTFQEDSDSSGWIYFRSPNGTILDKSNCAGIFGVSQNDSSGFQYMTLQGIMVNSENRWRVQLVDPRTKEPYVNMHITARILAYISKDVL